MPNKVIIYIHGKGGNADDSEYFKPLFPKYDILGFDYKSENPWDAEKEYKEYFTALSKKYSSITVIASSLGAFLLMASDISNLINKAFFVSPIVNMECIIVGMMLQANISEEELKNKGIIYVSPETTLSWKYLEWARKHTIIWNVPTFILYGEKDHFQTLDTIKEFAESIKADLTIMPDGEHWFHTNEQNEFRWNWFKKYTDCKPL